MNRVGSLKVLGILPFLMPLIHLSRAIAGGFSKPPAIIEQFSQWYHRKHWSIRVVSRNLDLQQYLGYQFIKLPAKILLGISNYILTLFFLYHSAITTTFPTKFEKGIPQTNHFISYSERIERSTS